MPRVTHDDLWLCDDCTIMAVNGDDSALDNMRPEDAERRRAEMSAGFEHLATLGHLVSDDDGETGDGREEFSNRPCACCESGRGSTRIAGSRTRFAILGD
jgi:hypothetical protein